MSRVSVRDISPFNNKHITIHSTNRLKHMLITFNVLFIYLLIYLFIYSRALFLIQAKDAGCDNEILRQIRIH